MKIRIPGFSVTTEVESDGEPLFRHHPVVSYVLGDDGNRILGTFTDLTEVGRFVVTRDNRLANENARPTFWRMTGADTFAGYADTDIGKPPRYFLRVEGQRG